MWTSRWNDARTNNFFNSCNRFRLGAGCPEGLLWAAGEGISSGGRDIGTGSENTGKAPFGWKCYKNLFAVVLVNLVFFWECEFRSDLQFTLSLTAAAMYVVPLYTQYVSQGSFFITFLSLAPSPFLSFVSRYLYLHISLSFSISLCSSLILFLCSRSLAVSRPPGLSK